MPSIVFDCGEKLVISPFTQRWKRFQICWTKTSSLGSFEESIISIHLRCIQKSTPCRGSVYEFCNNLNIVWRSALLIPCERIVRSAYSERAHAPRNSDTWSAWKMYVQLKSKFPKLVHYCFCDFLFFTPLNSTFQLASFYISYVLIFCA